MQARTQAFNFRLVASATLVVLFASVLVAQETANDNSRENYERALNNGLFDEAAVAAKSRLDQAIRSGQGRELSAAELLDDLAEAQRLMGAYDSALQNYELAVDIVVTERDMLDIALTEPLLGIGKTYLEIGRADLALDYLQRALHVRTVNDGPHSIEQAETLEVLADSYRSLGKPRKAADAADRLYLLYSRKFSANSMQLVPILLKQGHILGDISDWRRQRKAYNDALKIIETADGKSSVHSIRPLLSLGNSHSREYFNQFIQAENEEDLPDKNLLANAEIFYESAFDLVPNVADEDWRIAQDALLTIGDFYTMTDEQSRARVLYRSAWNLLSADDEKLLQRRINLEQVTPLLQPEPDLNVALPPKADPETKSAKYQTGFIVSQFTVTRRGKLADLGLLEISPERNEVIEAEVREALNRFIYRPRFVLGAPVDTTGERIRYEFPYARSIDRTEKSVD